MITTTNDKVANVFNIERCSSEDGSGIRTVVFLKGCELKCRWCANPESQSFLDELLYLSNPCVDCGRCVSICPNNAITYSTEFGYITNMSQCSKCEYCIDNCFVNARVMMGKKMTTDELLNELLRDEKYYKMSGGGVTFSGGEPLIYSSYIREIAIKLKAYDITTLIETCGYIEQSKLVDIIDIADMIYYDIKHMNSKTHEELTGKPNELILSNLAYLNKHYQGKLSVRYPVIPNCNDNDADIVAFLDYIKSLETIKEVYFLPYHRLGLTKYNGLGRRYEMVDTQALTVNDLAYLKDKQKGYSFEIKIK